MAEKWITFWSVTLVPVLPGFATTVYPMLFKHVVYRSNTSLLFNKQ